MKFLSLCLVALACPVPSSYGMIFWGLGNTDNRTNPGDSLPWNAVAKMTQSDGVQISGNFGSAVHLGGGYMITADHVASTSHVSFDGIAHHAVDTSFSQVVLGPGVDARIFRIIDAPSESAVFLDKPIEMVAGLAPLSEASVTLIGWGVGREEPIPAGTATVAWGSDTTAEKRWGKNVLNPYSITSPAPYDILVTHSGRLSADEASATRLDSGSGLFQKINGIWYLVGVTATTTTRNGSGTVTFGSIDSFLGTNGDQNGFVRVSSYAAQIQSITGIPEAGACAWTVMAAAAGLAVAGSQRLRRRDSIARRSVFPRSSSGSSET